MSIECLFPYIYIQIRHNTIPSNRNIIMMLETENEDLLHFFCIRLYFIFIFGL